MTLPAREKPCTSASIITMKTLSTRDIISLGCMAFALFMGAGNIIFPPIIGLHSGENILYSGSGFLISAVGLPVVTIVALARVGGKMNQLSEHLGPVTGLILALVCYLCLGPLFVVPRTTTVSFEVGISPLIGNDGHQLAIYSLIYFALVYLFSLYPGKLLDLIGGVLAPIKIVALIILGASAFFVVWHYHLGSVSEAYHSHPFSNGFVSGYLTMDTLSALVFGGVIVNAIHSRGVSESTLITRYTIIAGLIAGSGLILVYIALFRLGLVSYEFVPDASNGAEVLHAFVQHTFGETGSLFLALLIFIACLVTAIGLTSACASWFSNLIPLSYKTMVLVIAVLSFGISNLGLTRLITVSVPLLTAVYPPCIAIVLLSFTTSWWKNPARVFAPVVAVACVFGLVDGIIASPLNGMLNQVPSHLLKPLPLFSQSLEWLLPCAVVLVIASVIDGKKRQEAYED